MKKSIFTLVLAIAYLSIFAAPITNSKDIEFILTEDGITFVTNLRHGINNNLTAKNDAGEKIVFNLDEVKAYRKDGKEFHCKYFVEEGSQVVRKTFLQKIYTRAGYSVYKREKRMNENTNIEDYFVYKNETQEYQLNKRNYKTILSFFFPKFNLLYS
ncbi:MAG: hypothetical protein K8R49_07205 [Candidatus Cloacimonetes bacterium]|nr:hypothetical protein [Candidatus Cloacimonadota bacterium]